MRADLRLCDSVLHVSTTKGLRDRYPFGSVNDAALAEAEGVTAPHYPTCPKRPFAALDAAITEDLR
ncbi:hypothetical protein BFJ69_g14528 [Fusarium oxysporum]|uniref:Uncharacterized protein n=1 Tax=Fusarium oxysporum TaxID=5507 RepID=A0A420MHA8_FUSOX|nr:hypothetical protein BFJ69_g14528 [Fusarium oxysporum]